MQAVVPRRTGPTALVEAAAFFLPMAGALSQTRGEPLWRSDGAVLAALDSAAGFQGALSHFLAQAALLLPLGSHGFRLAVPAALFCGLAGLSILHLSHTFFRKQGGYSRLDPWLALGASLSASFSLPWITEASVAGGAAVAGGLALLLIQSLISGGMPRTTLGSAWGGVVVGALAAESLMAAGLVFLAALIVWPETKGLLNKEKEQRLRHIARWGALLGAALVTTGVLWLPAATSHSLVSLTKAGGAQSASVWPLWSPLVWIGSIGFLWTAGALFALLFSLEDRRPLYALGLIIAADWFVPGNGALGWTASQVTDPGRISIHLVALALIAPLGALGLRTLGESAEALRLFAARPLAAMVAVLAIAGCLASAEDSIRSLSQTGTSGSQAFTDEALHALPDGALVLTKNPALGRRLLAAQAMGARPDVLVVPLGDVTRPETLHTWLKKEPELETLLRDLSVSETPSERALARLIDRRPVVLEADPTWDRRLLEHLIPAVPLAGFSSHAVGRSDRLAALELVPGPRDRIVARYEEGLTNDEATKAALLFGFDQTKAVLDAVKDGQSSRTLEELRPDHEPSEGSDEEKSLSPVAALTSD